MKILQRQLPGICGLILFAALGLIPCTVLAQTTPSSPTAEQRESYRKQAEIDEQQARQYKKEANAKEAQARMEDRAADESKAEDSDVNVYRHSTMVHTLARMFGLSTEATARIFEVLNFLILAVAVLWFVVRLLPKALRSRRERIQKSLQDARIATEDANRRLQDVEQRLSRLDSEIDALKHQAQHETAVDETRIRAAMEQEKDRLVHAAEQEIQSVGANAQRRLKSLAAELIVEYASHNVSLQPETDRSLVRSFVADLGNKGRGEGRN